LPPPLENASLLELIQENNLSLSKEPQISLGSVFFYLPICGKVCLCEDGLLPLPGFLPLGQKTHHASWSLTKTHFSTDCF